MNIAIPLRLSDNKYYLSKTYTNKITPIFINKDNLFLLDICDGLLLPGGYDLAGFWYGENDYHCNEVNLYNDWLDFYFIYYALRHKKPLLGICRGLQSINVYFDGTLDKDISNHSETTHKIKTKNKIYHVNSFHHQGIKKIGTHLKALASSPDSLIEIIAHEFHDIVGLQFHPELLNKDFISIYFKEKLSHSVSLRYFEPADPT